MSGAVSFGLSAADTIYRAFVPMKDELDHIDVQINDVNFDVRNSVNSNFNENLTEALTCANCEFDVNTSQLESVGKVSPVCLFDDTEFSKLIAHIDNMNVPALVNKPNQTRTWPSEPIQFSQASQKELVEALNAQTPLLRFRDDQLQNHFQGQHFFNEETEKYTAQKIASALDSENADKLQWELHDYDITSYGGHMYVSNLLHHAVDRVSKKFTSENLAHLSDQTSKLDKISEQISSTSEVDREQKELTQICSLGKLGHTYMDDFGKAVIDICDEDGSLPANMRSCIRDGELWRKNDRLEFGSGASTFPTLDVARNKIHVCRPEPGREEVSIDECAGGTYLLLGDYLVLKNLDAFECPANALTPNVDRKTQCDFSKFEALKLHGFDSPAFYEKVSTGTGSAVSSAQCDALRRQNKTFSISASTAGNA